MIDAAISRIGRAVQIPFQGPTPYSTSAASSDELADYDTALRNRGSLTIWFTDEALAGWKAQPRTTPGGQPLEGRSGNQSLQACNRRYLEIPRRCPPRDRSRNCGQIAQSYARSRASHLRPCRIIDLSPAPTRASQPPCNKVAGRCVSVSTANLWCCAAACHVEVVGSPNSG